MKTIFLALAMLFTAHAALSQTEDDLVRASQAIMEKVKAGQLSELDQYKQIYRLVADMPSSYRYKAENLRMLSARIDTWQAVEEGKITGEKANRNITQQNADYIESTQRQAEAARAQERNRQESRAAQADARDERLLLQMFQNNRASQTQCRTVPIYGGGFSTVCN